MAGFLRHIGRHGDRKIAVVFREVPNEPHMCLVVYTEILNQHIHDPLMKCIESDIGQNSENLADALNRTYAKDGRPILQVLHKEGQLKKIQTEQVVMIPTPTTKIKLSELNVMLDEMQKGEDAVKRLAEMDREAGMSGKAEVIRKMRGKQEQDKNIQGSGDILGDQALAKQRLEQAQKMEREANGLLAESRRLIEEAKQLDPSLSQANAVVASTLGEKQLSMTPSAIRSREARARAKAAKASEINT